ncbi:MAG: DUF5076 domain-containing protein [Sphingomonas sp.]|nr:DUF5076 domain-containing protein [Sphingomonas sp.]
MDLMPFIDSLRGAREFLRIWATEDGRLNCFVNPRGLGADPALFGVALRDSMTHAAAAWSRATGIPEDEALARIREGFDQDADTPTNDLPPPVVVARKDH